MAATNPFRVSDLVSKYGWQAMIYLANLGVRNLAEAQVLFVDSGHTNALDADDTEHGHSFEKPLATLDYAIGLCTADEGCVILSAPGHNENIGTGEEIDFDVAGVTYVSLGTGTLRARFDFDAANSAINIGASNVTLVNLTIRPGFADVLIGIDIETTKTNTRIVDCEALEGEASGDEFLAAVELKAGCHDTVIEDSVFRAGYSSNPDDGISLKGASNRVTIRKNRFSGPYGDGAGVTAAISNSSGVCLDLLIEDNVMKVKDGESGIEVISTTPAIIRHNLIISTGLAVDSMIVGTIAELDQNIGVTTDGTSGEFIKGGALSPEIVAYNLDKLLKVSTSVAADGELDGIITDRSVFGHIMATDADPSNYNASTDSLQSIATAVGAITNQTGVINAVPASPVAISLQDILNENRTGSHTYSSSTDSLEAISNLLRDDSDVLAGINLDHLAKITTGVAVDDELDQHITALSILGHIMATDADPSSYNCSTDSLQSIAAAVTGFTTAVSQTPTERSVQDILEKNNSGDFDDSTDSLEAISDSLLLAIGDVGSPAAGSVLDILKKLYYAADGSGKYPATVVNDSALAKIMSSADPANANTFENDTDSLQAIRDNQQTAARAAIDDAELDHLCELDGTAAYAENIANDSIIAKIMCIGATATANTFNNTTDSLEAISDFVRTGTSLGAGVNLDHLLLIDGASEVYPEQCAVDSVIAKMIATDADPTTFDSTTDSLQAISDFVRVGTTLGAGIQLDHLQATTTGVNLDGDLSAYAVTKSLMAHIMSATAVGSTFKASTDSLEAIAVLLATVSADSTYIADGALPVAPTTDSLASFIAGGGTALGTNLADSKSIIDAIGHTGAAFHTSGIGYWTEKTVMKTAVVDADDLFTVAGGNIRIISLVGQVTGVVQGQQVQLKVVVDAETADYDRDFSTQVDLNGDAKGTLYVFSTANPAVLTPLTGSGTGGGNPQLPWFCPPGTIETENADGVATGTIVWTLTYVPLETGVTVVAAG